MKLEAVALTKSFGEKRVLEGISITAESGKAVGILGRNGAGKTTTIRIIMGVFPGDSGQVLLDGEPIDHKKTYIGYLPEERGLYPKKTVIEQLVYLGELRGMKRADAKADATRLLARLEMTEYTGKKLDTLSKGNQQKIQLIAALLGDPAIVILDEPFSGLDPVNAMLLKDTVKDLISRGKIVLFSSHQMNYIEEFCDQINILNHGEIVLSGNIKEIKRGYQRDKILVSGSDLEGMRRFVEGELSAICRSVTQNDGQLAVTLKAPEQKGELLAALTQKGFDLDEFRVYEPSLNDIFVEYTEE